MKCNYYHVNHNGPLEVYKLQVALFGGPSVLIYNEDRTEMLETQDKQEIEQIKQFVGKDTLKCYICGYYDKKLKKIVIVDKVDDEQYFF